MNELLQYTINSSSTLLSAMQKIDANKKGYLVILDDNNKVVGTLTDGDIRRALLATHSLDQTVDGSYTTSFKYVKTDDAFASVIELFKDTKVKFLPIVDEEMHLHNVITKPNLHVLLLQDIPYNPYYPFHTLDDSVLEHEIFPRPWGYYKTAFLNQYCQCKMICVNPRGALSLQKHMHRDEHWIVVHGKGTLRVGDRICDVKSGESYEIPRGVLHRIMNESDDETLIVTEVQLGDYFGEDDIIRVEDVYGRC